MTARRKQFRIEQMVSAEAPSDVFVQAAELAFSQHEIVRELAALRALLERHMLLDQSQVDAVGADKTEAKRLKNELRLIYEAITRTKQEIAMVHVGGFGDPGIMCVTQELGAVVGGTEVATQQILNAAEDIDQSANTLSASVNSEHAQGLTQDIQDRVIQIFEACNFQDLTGQRINKVMATLKFIETRVVNMMEIWGGAEAFKEFASAALAERPGAGKLTHGPKLEGVAGHVSQSEIDEIFATAIVRAPAA
jgi:chemotaxis protein CheZ